MYALFRRLFALSFLIPAALLLAGCASSAIVVGKVRPAIQPEQVKVYLRAPRKFEEIALLEASSKGSWAFSSQGKMNKVVARLKQEAADLGANGVLLQGTGNEYGGSVNSGVANATMSGNSVSGTGFGTSVGVVHKAGQGVAIFVEEE